MVAEGWIASKLGIFGESDHERQKALLRRIIKSSKIETRLDTRQILGFAKLDKKSTAASIRMALPEKNRKDARKEKWNYLTPVSKESVSSNRCK